MAKRDNGAATSPAQVTLIYVLKDPRDGAVRYVGKTSKTLERRLKQHVKDAIGALKSAYVYRWIRTLHAEGFVPVIELVAEVGADWPQHERHWIKFHRAAGARLTNATIGGEGPSGLKWSDESRAKQAAIARNRSPEARAKMSAAAKERALRPGERERRSAARKGKLYSDESKAKISALHKGAKRSPEIRARFSAYQKQRYSDPAEREKTSAAAKKRYRDPAQHILTSQSILAGNARRRIQSNQLQLLFKDEGDHIERNLPPDGTET